MNLPADDNRITDEAAHAARERPSLLIDGAGTVVRWNAAAAELLGLPGGSVRPPLPDATDAEIDRLRIDLAAGGVKLQ